MTSLPRVLSLYEGFFAGGARILHTDVVAALHASGAQRHSVLSLASRAKREGTVQHLAHDARYQRLVGMGVDVRSLGRTAGSAPLEPSVFTDRQLRRAATLIARADVVLSLKEQPLGLLLALRERGMMPDVPVAACLHRSDPEHSGPALGWLTDAARTGLLSATISCAQSTSDAYASSVSTSVDSFVVPNGIDLDRFRPGDAAEIAATKASLGIPSGAPVVIYAARFDAMKDPGLFLRAVARHRAERADAHYVMCGAGMSADNPAFVALLAETGMTGAPRLHPLGVRDDMPALYRIADVVALTSAFGEASPLCLIEGAASGATPVTTDVGDSARQVEGIGVVTSHDPHDIAGVWSTVLDRREQHRDRVLAARPRLSRDRMVGDYRSAIEALADRMRLAA